MAFTSTTKRCPNCGYVGTFTKRKGFHFLGIGQWYCHHCKSTFSKPDEVENITSRSEQSYVSNTTNRRISNRPLITFNKKRQGRKLGRKGKIRLL